MQKYTTYPGFFTWKAMYIVLKTFGKMYLFQWLLDKIIDLRCPVDCFSPKVTKLDIKNLKDLFADATFS